MSGHFSDVKKLVCKDIQSDSYAKRFAEVFKNNSYPQVPTLAILRSLAEFKVLWKGNILSLMK